MANTENNLKAESAAAEIRALIKAARGVLDGLRGSPPVKGEAALVIAVRKAKATWPTFGKDWR